MRRDAIVFALAFAFAGCTKEVTREDPNKDTHVDTRPGLYEVNDCANKFLNEKLAPFRFPDDAVQKYGMPMPVALLPFRNDTNEHFDTQLLGDSLRETLQNSGKVAFQITQDRIADSMNQQAYENSSNSTDPNQIKTEGQAAGTRYSLYGRIANLDKRDRAEGVHENTIIVTIEMLDKQRNLSVLIQRDTYRLRRQ
jgi:PBP1b-binding outer membrane lipoprotein LpoB